MVGISCMVRKPIVIEILDLFINKAQQANDGSLGIFKHIKH